MKRARLILWVLTPVAFVAVLFLAYFRVIRSLLAANLLTSLVFLLPITAMLLQTLENREKHEDTFFLKLVFVCCLYLMVGFMFYFSVRGTLG